MTLAAELAGQAVAEAVQLGLEYSPAPPFDAGSPQSAPAEVLARVRARAEPLRAERQRLVEVWLTSQPLVR